MCVSSMVGDFYRDKLYPGRLSYPGASTALPDPRQPNQWPFQIPASGPTQSEFDALKREVWDMKELLKLASEYDRKTGQPDCETDEKMAVLRGVAKLVGVNLDDVLGPQPPVRS